MPRPRSEWITGRSGRAFLAPGRLEGPQRLPEGRVHGDGPAAPGPLPARVGEGDLFGDVALGVGRHGPGEGGDLLGPEACLIAGAEGRPAAPCPARTAGHFFAWLMRFWPSES